MLLPHHPCLPEPRGTRRLCPLPPPPHPAMGFPVQAGVADMRPQDIITNLLRADTAYRFNISQGGLRLAIAG